MAERKKLLLRINPSLWEELNRWAAQEFRSVNGQIEFLLQRAVAERKRAGAEGDDAGPTGNSR
jgi:hypothetical protein